MSKEHIARPEWLSVKKLFGDKNGFQFVIPVYQRDYVWNAENQVRRLLDDYQNMLETEENHFLGIIIDYLENKGRGYAQQYFVIDGQQRLTTLFLLIYVLYEKAMQENDEESIDKLENCLFVSPKKKQDGGFKLDPIMNGTGVFTKIVTGESATLTEEEKESKLGDAYFFIKDYVTDVLSDYKLEELIEGLDRLMLVDIPLDEGDNAQQIFESINALGSQLSASDLIRNFVIMQCPEGTKKDFYNRYWLPFENKFKAEREFEEFFRYFVEAQKGDFVNKRQVYDEFRNWFLENSKATSAEEILKELSRYADYYCNLYYKEIKAYAKNNLWKAINDFRNIKSNMPIPFMMEIMRLYEEAVIDNHQFNAIITTINSFIVRRAIIGLDTSGITKFFCQLLKKVRILVSDNDAKIVDAVNYCVLNEANESGSRFPTDSEIRKTLDGQNTYQYKDALHFFFDKYENEKMQVDSYQRTLDLQIEHIMPQDGSKWYAEVGLPQGEYDLNKMRLGNLTLATKHDNPKMSNNLFEYKTAILKDTAHFRLNVDVYSQPKWGKDEIDARNKMLIEEFIRLYPIPVCERTAEFNAIRAEQKKKVKNNRGRDAYAAKLWERIDDVLDDRAVFEVKHSAVIRAYRDFVFNKPYHLFIDLWNYKDKKVNFGIWFSNAKNPNFSIFVEHMDELNSPDFTYISKSEDGARRGVIMASIDLISADDDRFNDFVDKIMTEIYRMYDFTAEYCLDDSSSDTGDRMTVFRFSLVQIPVGETIEFSCHGSENDGALCKVISDRQVEYDGKVWSLSLLAATLSHRTTQVAGPRYFKYKGEWLNDIRHRLGV